MKLNLKEKNSYLRSLNVIVPWEELKNEYYKEFKKIKSNYSMPGFRKGSVPDKILRKNLGKSIDGNFIDHALNIYYGQALKDLKINPINQGKVIDVNFEELSVRFIVDEHLKNWTEIYDRIIALGLAEGGENYRLLKAKSDTTQRGGTVSTLVLTVLTSAMNPQMEFHFYEAFPITLSALDFDSANTDLEYFTATAAFRYTNYEIKNLLNN